MSDQFIRTEMLVGSNALARLHGAKVAVFGVGGVGGFCVEALARAGVGALHLYDDDTVSVSNLNRQIAAVRMFYLPENADQIDLSQYDYVADCIDTVAAKLELVQRCTRLNVPIISAMGTGNKLDPTLLRVSDISKTENCPLARVMRKELRRRGIDHLKVVWSPEEPRTPLAPIQTETPADSIRPGSTARRATPGSISFVPGAAGLIMAGAILRQLGDF